MRSDKIPKIQRAAGLLDTLAVPLVLLGFLRQFTVRLETVVTVGLVIGSGAWFVGPGRLARVLRTTGDWLIASTRLGARRLGWRTTAADRWVAVHVRALRAAALLLVVAVYALWKSRCTHSGTSQPDPSSSGSRSCCWCGAGGGPVLIRGKEAGRMSTCLEPVGRTSHCRDEV